MKLVVKNLSGERAGQLIFADISFELEKGDALIVTGSNGSGKSTLLRVITGLLPPEGGSVSLTSTSEDGEEPIAAENMHYLGHLNALKLALNVEENLIFWQNYCGNPFMDIEGALKEVGLAGIGNLPAACLSAGQKRRVSIAKLLVSHKPVWVVDEPTAALDKASEGNFANLIMKHRTAGGIVIAATHQSLGVDDTELGTVKTLDLDEVGAHNTRAIGQLI